MAALFDPQVCYLAHCLIKSGASSHFAAPQAASYAEYRPKYPEHLYALVLDFAKLPRKQLAVDVGCGSGQVAAALAQHFERVIGMDVSAEQLRHAAQASPPNVEYRQAPAEDLALPAGSVDLITAATSLHWWAGGRLVRAALLGCAACRLRFAFVCLSPCGNTELGRP